MDTIVTPDEQAAALLGKQHATISGRQAVALGLTRRQVRTRIATGRWVRRARDVCVLAGSPDTWRQRAMVAYLATLDAGGVVSDTTAGAVHGVLTPSLLPHITVPPGRSHRSGVAKVHRRPISSQDRQHKDGMFVTTPSRLLVDMATHAGRSPLEELVDDVLCRGLASVNSVLASLERSPGGRGHPLLRDVLAAWSPGITPGSVAEMRLLRLLGDFDVADLVAQHEVRERDGTFVARLDLARPASRKGLEYESVRYHNPRRWAHDEARYGRLRAAGWDVRSVTKADLTPGETRLADLAAWLVT